MTKKENITTLAELEAAQEKLKLVMDATSEEFTNSIGTTKKHLKTYLLKNVALPVGAVGLGVASLNQFGKKEDHGEQVVGVLGLLAALAPLAKKIWKNYKSHPGLEKPTNSTLRAKIRTVGEQVPTLVEPTVSTIRRVDNDPEFIDLAKKYSE